MWFSNKISMEYQKIKNPGNLKELALATFYYISGSILGPLLVFLGLGYLLDNVLKTKPKMLIIGFFVAFVVTNILLFKKVMAINKTLDSYNKEAESKEKNK
jgi:F0F1-type ATP synthase assembly protein I